MNWRRYLLPFLILLLVVNELDARVGGGGSYSGSSSSSSKSSGGGGDAGVILWLLIRLFELHFYAPKFALIVDAILIAFFVYFCYFKKDSQKRDYSSNQLEPEVREEREASREQNQQHYKEWRKYDPNFSELLFEDFLHGLYANVHTARGLGKLDDYAPFVNDWSRKELSNVGPEDLKEVLGIVIGSFEIIETSGAEETLSATARFEANYTERTQSGKEQSWYVVEEWTLERERDVLSKPPGGVRAGNCPKCGGGLEFTADRKCRFCSAVVEGGVYDWGVVSVRTLKRESRGPLLTQEVPDVGLDSPTVFHKNLNFELQRLKTRAKDFDEDRFLERVQTIFLELQEAWSSMDWNKARPYETDAVFEMHRYWIEAYKKQGLRNVLDNVEIGHVQIAKVVQDAFHDAITCRIYASMNDYVVDSNGKVVRGSPKKEVRFSEYWTFVRRRGVKDSKQDDKNCPNCGAGLKITMAGVCEYCNSKITNGDFDWVLSRIEQDEAYAG